MAKVNDTNSDIAVSVSGVSKYFPPTKGQGSLKQLFTSAFKKQEVGEKGYWALKGVDFTVKKGEFFGIVGRNGSGKSTLLKMIAGVYSPTKGSISVNGKLVPFIELGVGFNPELSGRDNVFLNGALLGFSRKEMASMYEEIVEFAELEEHMDVKLKNYSSGMHVRLAFSIAVRAKAEILLIDEVLAVGDAAFQQKCFNYFEDLKKQSKTVIFVSHDMASVRRFCKNSIYIEDGKITHSGTSVEIADVYAEANIQKVNDEETNEDELEQSNSHTVRSKVTKKSDDKLELSINYTTKDEEEMYVGMSILRDGMSIAELSTAMDKPLIGSGSLVYTLDTSVFNAGVYQIGIGLYKLNNRELLAIPSSRNQFFVKGEDITKGAALKLPDSWKYLK